MKKVLSMRFLFSVVLSIALIFLYCGSESSKNNGKPAKTGNLKTITQKIIYYQNGKELKDTLLYQARKLNSGNEPVEVISYYPLDKSIVSADEYKYNEKGKIIFEKRTSYSTSIKGYSVSYEYDDKNRMIKRNVFDETGNTVNEYHNEFRDTLRIKELQYSPKLTLLRETNIFYDGHNNNIKSEGKYFDKPLTFKMLYEFDKDNKKIKEEVYRADDGINMYLVSRVQLFYDVKGRLIQQLGFNGKGEQTVTSTRAFNDMNQVTESTLINTLTNEYKKSSFKYDSNGLVTEEICYLKSGEIGHKYLFFY